MAITPPGASASNTRFNSFLLRASPSLCRMCPSVAKSYPLPRFTSLMSPSMKLN